MVDKQKESGYIEQVESGTLVPIAEEVLEEIPLNASSSDIANKIVKAKSQDELKRYTDLFNMSLAKQNAVRIVKLNSLLDKVNDEAIRRVEKRPDEITNSEVLAYMKTVQESINNAQKNLESLNDKPMITLNQQNNNVTVNLGGDAASNRQSKEKIIEAVRGLLKLSEEIKQSENNTSVQTEDAVEANVVDLESEPTEENEEDTVLLEEDEDDIIDIE